MIHVTLLSNLYTQVPILLAQFQPLANLVGHFFDRTILDNISLPTEHNISSCSNYRKQMSQLLIEHNFLSGTIDFFDGDFPSLLFLHYGSNYLSGEMPEQLSRVSTLQTLVLGINQLSGHILPSLASLTNLNQLVLSQNLLSGSSSSGFQSWKHLSALSIFENYQLDFDLDLLPLLPNLQYALLHNCAIRGHHLPQNASSNLKFLLLRNNRLSGTVQISPDQNPSIYRLLETLDLSKNEISGVLPLVPPPALREILLNDMALSGTLPFGAGQTAWQRLAVFRFVRCSLYLFSAMLAFALPVLPSHCLGPLCSS